MCNSIYWVNIFSHWSSFAILQWSLENSTILNFVIWRHIKQCAGMNFFCRKVGPRIWHGWFAPLPPNAIIANFMGLWTCRGYRQFLDKHMVLGALTGERNWSYGFLQKSSCLASWEQTLEHQSHRSSWAESKQQESIPVGCSSARLPTVCTCFSSHRMTTSTSRGCGGGVFPERTSFNRSQVMTTRCH